MMTAEFMLSKHPVSNLLCFFFLFQVCVLFTDKDNVLEALYMLMMQEKKERIRNNVLESEKDGNIREQGWRICETRENMWHAASSFLTRHLIL